MNTYTIHIKKRHTVVMYYGNMYLLNIFGKVEFCNEKKIYTSYCTRSLSLLHQARLVLVLCN